MSKTIVITGTSSGLGLKSSIMLAQQGHQVFATMRNLKKQSALLDEANDAGVSLKVLPLDVVDLSSIDAAIQTVLQDAGKIDVLINNAGAGFAKNIEQASEQEMKWVTDVNYFGVVRCCQAVIPHMRKAQRGQVINITSVGGLVGQPFNELYCAAKFAVEGFTESLATVLTKNFGIHFSLVEPGGIATEFSTSAAKATLGEHGIPDDAYSQIFQKYLAGFQERAASPDDSSIYQTPQEIAELIVDLVNNESPPLRVRTSKWGEEFCQFKTAADPDGLKQTADVTSRFLGQ